MTRNALLVFIARRMGLAVVLLVVLSFAVFCLLYLSPGSVEGALIGNHDATPEIVANIRAKFHLDQPFVAQFWFWLSNVAHLDFGTSVRSGEEVSSMLARAAGVSFFLGLYAFFIALFAGVPLGVLAAMRHRRPTDRAVVGLGVLTSSAPVFVTGVALLYAFAVRLHVFPAYGSGDGFLDRLWHLTLPAITLGVAVMTLIIKLTRTAVIGILDQDYVAFARARGASPSGVLVRYVLRNALIPIITAGGLVLTAVLGGAVVIEVTFSLDGLGAMLINGVNGKDYPVVQGVALLVAVVVVLVNLLVDVAYSLVDPRIVFGRARE